MNEIVNDNCVANGVSEFILASWTHINDEPFRSHVIPDGCRDVIIEVIDDYVSQIYITQLSGTPCLVDIPSGVRKLGFRLKPGVSINPTSLRKLVMRDDLLRFLDVAQLDECCERTTAITESLECLGSGLSSVADCAKQLGVSVRTLQRVVKLETGVTPMFWFSLSRVRRTSRSLHRFEQLAEAAHVFNYSDQSHMTREVRRWLGVTPTAIKPESEVFTQLCNSGYY